MLKKIKEYAKEAADDALKDLVKSAVTGFIMALVAGATTLFSGLIPSEFKQNDVLFVIVALSFIFGMGVLLFLRASRWSLRIVCLCVMAASVEGSYQYFRYSLLHGLPDYKDNIVLIVLPESVERYEFQSYVLNLASRLPKVIRGSEFKAQLHYIHTPLAGNLYIDNPEAHRSLLSRYIANARHILGVVEVVESQEGFVIKTSVPAIEKYFDLGLSSLLSQLISLTTPSSIEGMVLYIQVVV